MKGYLGIDGGGTKTEFVLTDESGNVLARALKRGCNPNDIGVDACFAILREGIAEIVDATKKSELYIFAGVSGAGVGDNAKTLTEKLSTLYKNVRVTSDLNNAVEASLKGADGVAVVCGTGISCALRKGNEYKTVGGYGYLFEDGGSGYGYGRDAVKAALRFEDGYGEATALAATLRKRFGRSVRDSLGELLRGGKSAVAALCPLVFEGYNAGDKVCGEIVRSNLDCTVALIQDALSVYKATGGKLGFIGGITRESAFQKRMTAVFGKRYELIFGEVKPVYGAVRLAAATAGNVCNQEFENNYIRTVTK